MKRHLILSLIPALWVSGEMITLEEIIVTSTTLEEKEALEKGSQSTLSAASLLKRGDVTLPEILQREPGVSVPLDLEGTDALVPFLQGGSQGVNIRGLQGDRVELTIDGIDQPDDSTTRTFLGAGGPGRIYFDPAVFADLQIFKSGSPGSGALAGTLAGQTESPFSLLGPELTGYKFKSNTSYASQNRSWNERIAAAWGNGDFASSIVYSYRHGHELTSNGPLPTNPSDTESHAFVWKSVWRHGAWTLEPTFDYFRSTGFTDLLSNEGMTSIGTVEDASNDAERERYRLSLDFKNETPHLLYDQLSGKVYYQNSTSKNFNIQDLIAPNGDRRDRINKLNYDNEILGLNLSLEKELNNHQLSARYKGSRKDISGSLRRTDRPAPEENRPNLAPSIAWDHSLSIVDEISVGSRWTITPSIRLHHYQVNPTNTQDFLDQSRVPLRDSNATALRDENGDLVFLTVEAADYDNFYLSPSLHIDYAASNEVTLFASYTQGFRNPTAEELAGVFVHPDDLSITVPNPDLEAESSHNFELGLRYNTDRWSTVFSAYYNQYDNFLQSGIPTGTFTDRFEILRTENIESVEIYGAELKTEYTSDHYRIGGTLAWSQGFGDLGPLNSVEPWKAVAWLAYEPSETWGMELSGTFVAGKRESRISPNRTTGVKVAGTDSHFLLDLTGYYHFNDHITLRGGIKNILDEEYILWSRANRGGGHNGQTNSSFSQPGTNGFVSVAIEF